MKKEDNLNNEIETKEKKMLWFTNDADGLSMVDALTVFYTTFYLIAKVVYVWLVVSYSSNSVVITTLAGVNESIDSILMLIFSFYFLKKGVDTTVAKIVLGSKYGNLYTPIMQENPTFSGNGGIQGSISTDNFDLSVNYAPQPKDNITNQAQTMDGIVYSDDGTVG